MIAIAAEIDWSTVIAGHDHGHGDTTKHAGGGVLHGDSGITIIGSVRIGRDLRFRKPAAGRGPKAGECETGTHDLHELAAILALEVLRAFLELTIGECLELIGVRQIFEAAPQIPPLKTGRKRLPSPGLVVRILCGLGIVHAVLQVTGHLNDDRSSSSRKG
jgi:hypothetical protein